MILFLMQMVEMYSLKDGGTTFGSLTNTSGNLIIKSGTTTALTFSGANATIAGDLTISGDDLTMGTNTSGHIMVADGTNFNPVAVSGDVTIASNGAVTIADRCSRNCDGKCKRYYRSNCRNFYRQL